MLRLPGESQHVDILVAIQSAVALEDEGAIRGSELHRPRRLRLLVLILVASLVGGVKERIRRRAPAQHRGGVCRIVVLVLGLDLALGAFLVLIADKLDDSLLLLARPVVFVSPYAASQDEPDTLLLGIGVRIAGAEPNGLVVQIAATIFTLELACDGEYGMQIVGLLIIVSDVMF